MRFLVLFMMSVFTLVGMFAIALGVVYVFFCNGNEGPASGTGGHGCENPAAKQRGTGADNDDDEEERL